jgi:hypothetical protein
MNDYLSAVLAISVWVLGSIGAWYASTIGMRKRNELGNGEFHHVSRIEYFFIRVACLLPVINLFIICNYLDSFDYPEGKIKAWLFSKKYDI